MNKPAGSLRNRIIALFSILLVSAVLVYGISTLSARTQSAANPSLAVTPSPTPASSAAVTKAPTTTVKASPTSAKTSASAKSQPTAVSDVMHLSDVKASIDKQTVTDAALLAELENGGYTLHSPYVQVDPYGESPLSAIVLFDTSNKCRISVHVAGDTPKAEVDFAFKTYETRHAIPILGLYPDRDNQVTLTAVSEDGTQTSTVLAIETEPLSPFFDDFDLITETADEASYAEGLNFPVLCMNDIRYPFAFDCNGAVRWYLPNYKDDMEFFFIRDVEAGFIIGRGNSNGDSLLLNINALGRVLNGYYTAYGVHHDLYQTDHDSWVITGSDPTNTATVKDIAYELSTTDGSILHMIDFKTILERTRKYGDQYHTGNVDWMHMNAIEEYQGDVIVSSNFQSSVIRIGWDGRIKWMLTDPTEYLEMYDRYMLKPVGYPFEWSYNQHAVEVLPDQDGNPDTLDIILFDNGSSRSVVNDAVDTNYSRLVQYRIDEKNMTVEQVWAYGQNRPELYAAWRGDANVLANNNVLGTFNIMEGNNGTPAHGVYLEVNRNGDMVWQCLAQSNLKENIYLVYRCERMNGYTVNANRLRLGDAVSLCVPDAIWTQYQVAAPTQSAIATPEPTAVTPADTSAATAQTDAAAIAWQVTVESATLLAELNTDIDVEQYEGGYKTVNYHNTPASGMQFALFDLTVSKQKASKASFDWANLRLVLADGAAYARAEDTYLSDHGYSRINGTKLSLATTSGYACFEIPAGESLAGAVFQYTQDGQTVTFAIP